MTPVRGRERFVALLPWLLCACALTLLGLAALVRLAGADPGASGAEVVTPTIEAISFVSFPLVGAVIAARLPGNPYGWVWCALGLAYGVLAVCAAWADVGAASGWWLVVVGHVAYLTLAGLLVCVFLLFPTGRPPTPRWWWLVRAAVVLGVLLGAAVLVAPSVLFPDTDPPWAPGGVAGRLLADLVTVEVIAMLLLIPVAMASVAARFRRAGPVERQQLKWFVLAAAVNAVYVLADLFVGDVGGPVWVLLGVLTVSLVPAAVAIAVLRYRLYEIDRIISRSVSYGLLTAGLVGLYLLVVALLRPLLEPLTGSSALAVAGSTLAVAAVFNPARRRLQAVVDRRFDRARYDAAQAVDAFAARLRDQVDLDQVVVGLRDTVTATVAPTLVAVWLRVPSRPGAG